MQIDEDQEPSDKFRVAEEIKSEAGRAATILEIGLRNQQMNQLLSQN